MIGMLALILLAIIVIVFYLPSFGFKVRIGDKEFKIESGQVNSSESS